MDSAEINFVDSIVIATSDLFHFPHICLLL